MHEHSHSDMEKMAVRHAEIAFMQSPHGQPHYPEFAQLEKEKRALDAKYEQLWAKAKPAFMAYLRS